MKKLLSVLLVMALVLAALPLTALPALAAYSGGFEYEVLSEKDKTCAITDYTGSATALAIPSELNGYTVTRIGVSAFYGCTSLTSITIPDSVTSIGTDAFYDCTALTSITIPDSVTRIDDDAFYNTAYYNDATHWENDVLYIGNHLIDAKNTLSGAYTVRAGTKTIAGQAFYGCKSLTSITIPNSVTGIGGWAFYGCKSLTSITIPDSVTSIGNSAFAYCTALTSITIPNGVTSIGNCAFECCIALESITIPNSVMSIGDRVFYDCTSLTSITIPDSVTSIGFKEFYGCTALTSISIPDSVTSIDIDAFYDTAYYNDATHWENNVLYIGNHLIKANDTLNGAYTVRAGTKTITRYAFDNCSALTSITIPDSVTSIGDRAFRGCTALKSASIGNGVREIGDDAFSDCTSLTDLSVGYNVVSIWGSAFNSSPLKTVKGYVGSYAESWTSSHFDGYVDFIPLGRCPLVFGYYWNEYTGDVTVTDIWGTEKHVTVPETIEGLPVTSISGGRNSYLETLVLPSTLQTIGDYAFGDWVGDICCPKLKSVTIPDGVVSIGKCAFAQCPLTSITLPESVQSIGEEAFYGCFALSEIHLPQNLTHIGERAFYETAYYNTAENWEGTYIDYGYFVQGGLYVDNYLVDFGYGGETYKIREGTVLIADGTFDNPPANLVFPESIHTIGRGLFSGSGNHTISSITFLAADIDINWYAFDTVTLGEIRAYAGSDAQTYAEYKEIPFVDISEIKPNADGTGGTMAPRYGTAASDVAHTLETVLEDVESVTVLDKNGTEIKNLETLCTPDMQFAVTFANGKTAIYVFASQTSGDLNGDGKVNAVDARWVLQAASGVRTFDAAQTTAADVNGDGKVNAVDARWILQVASGARTL